MKDKLGQDLAVGDEVIIAAGMRDTHIGKIKSIATKMLTVDGGPSYSPTYKRYSAEVLKINRDAEKTTTIPVSIARTVLHALQLSGGMIADKKLDEVNNWVNNMIWTKE